MSARSVGWMILVAFVLVLLAGCAGGQQEQQQVEQQNKVYVGWLLGTTDLAAVAFDVGAADDQGASDVKAYVCDGLGPPSGLAVWFRGPVDEETVNQGDSQSMTSTGGQETLRIDHLDDNGVSGVFTPADGQPRRFDASPGQGGAGIYEVTINEDRSVSGTSTDGSSLAAQIDEEGNVQSTITTADGQEISGRGVGLAFASVGDLRERGLPTTYKKFAENTFVPGEYVALITPGSRYWLGRSGNVRAGRPSGEIIGLDKKVAR